MISCILVFYLSAFAGSPAQGDPDPDALYAQRKDINSARRAADLWKARVTADRSNFEAAWKLARANYWLGRHAPQGERKAFLDAGITAGRAAVTSQPNRPEGHFWTAVNMGALAESFGMRQGLKYRGDIRGELQIVLKLDPAFQQGSADRALGRWYFKVPGMFGGSRKKSEEHLRRSLGYNANSISSRFFLAETLLDMDRKAEALTELQRVIELPPDREWEPEDREFKQMAERLLATLRQKK
ncbi:MAG: hypothetical protein H0W08_27810 [Acidobacteria bacterium]|nr:hypothetical protein [Acidobacteriota bacterium]